MKELVRKTVSKVAACAALGVNRATFYRRERPGCPVRQARPRPVSARALTEVERAEVLAVLNSEKFVDVSPAAVFATLLDAGRYLCSARTMYRVLSACGEVRERRDQLRHPAYVKPQLVAKAPKEVWSWDITKLPGPAKWGHFSLYVLLDVYSRYVVGWMLARQESAALAVRLIEEAYRSQGIQPGQVAIHSDRGAPMTSKTLAQKMIELEILPSFSRPRVSNDNPFSEAAFKTIKYRPETPDRFGSFQDAHAWCRSTFDWYCNQHRHSGIGYLTPADVHFGRAAAILERRRAALAIAHAAHPERFVRGVPVPAGLPEEVWINPPKTLEVAIELAR